MLQIYRQILQDKSILDKSTNSLVAWLLIATFFNFFQWRRRGGGHALRNIVVQKKRYLRGLRIIITILGIRPRVSEIRIQIKSKQNPKLQHKNCKPDLPKVKQNNGRWRGQTAWKRQRVLTERYASSGRSEK